MGNHPFETETNTVTGKDGDNKPFSTYQPVQGKSANLNE